MVVVRGFVEIMKMNNTKLTIITSYHFNSSNIEAYKFLLRSLRVSANEINKNGRIILVANGTSEGAENPKKVIKDLNRSISTEIVEVDLSKNKENTGALNAGIEMALTFPLEDTDEEIIASVQSSCVLNNGWFESSKLYFEDEKTVGVFGRIFFDDDSNFIWADGHYLEEGQTKNYHYMNKQENNKNNFPCLSASFFKKTLVENIYNKYGNFVCENLCHYGDCTDVAIRAFEVFPNLKFKFLEEVTAFKRRTTKSLKKIQSSQLIAAGLYYENKKSDAEERLKEKIKNNKLDKNLYIDITSESKKLLLKSYSPKEINPPNCYKNIDKIWGK